jgi:hypothetical protein
MRVVKSNQPEVGGIVEVGGIACGGDVIIIGLAEKSIEAVCRIASDTRGVAVLTIIDPHDPGLGSTMSAAENQSILGLGSMSDHPASTMRTDGGESMNGAFEGVEIQGFASARRDLKRFVVIVSAGGTGFHGYGGWVGW